MGDLAERGGSGVVYCRACFAAFAAMFGCNPTVFLAETGRFVCAVAHGAGCYVRDALHAVLQSRHALNADRWLAESILESTIKLGASQTILESTF
jgi:hypothetical protein